MEPIWKRTEDTIYPIEFGIYWNPTCQDEGGSGVGLHEIIEPLSMQYFGYYEREPHGEICPQTMVDGVIRIAALSDGAIKESGSDYLRY